VDLSTRQILVDDASCPGIFAGNCHRAEEFSRSEIVRPISRAHALSPRALQKIHLIRKNYEASTENVPANPDDETATSGPPPLRQNMESSKNVKRDEPYPRLFFSAYRKNDGDLHQFLADIREHMKSYKDEEEVQNIDENVSCDPESLEQQKDGGLSSAPRFGN